MGRKPKYTTEEQRREAKAQYDADYYLRNRRKILRLRKKAYAAKTEDKAMRSTGSGDLEELDSTTRQVQRLFKTINKQLKLYHALIGSSIAAYGARLCEAALSAHSADEIEAALDKLQDIAEPAKMASSRIWELTGASEEDRRAKELIDPFRQGLNVVSNLLGEALTDPSTLQDLRKGRDNHTLAYFRL